MFKKFCKKMFKKTLQFLKDQIGTIIFLVVVAVLLLVGVLKVKDAKEHAITIADDYEAPEKTADLLKDGEYVSIASNDSLELFYNDVKGTIRIKDKKSGCIWNSVVDEEIYPNFSKSNKQWQANMQSAINIKYNDLKKRDSGVKEVFAAKDCGYLESKMIENGVEVTYGFLTPGIYITVDYTIEGDNLVVRIPYEKIEEKSKLAVTTITVLPWLGACGNENSGYLFYPDGSGAVTTFERVGERPSNVLLATYYTYSHKSMSYKTITDTDLHNRYTAAFPVCGIKNGDNAIFAYATEGGENTAVVVYPSGVSSVHLNRTSFDVFVRNVYDVNMYNVSSGKDTVATGGQVQRIDKELIKEDKEIRYSFLAGDQANYSGMAETYRNYLISTNQLGQSENVDNTSLALRLLMGTEKSGILFDEYVKMTDFNQAIDIIESLKTAGVDKQKVVLEAWQKGYYEYELWGPDSHLGGKSGLKKISEYAKSNANTDIFLENDVMTGTSDTKGLDEKKEVAYNGLNLETSLKSFEGTTYYFLNPVKINKNNSKILKKLKKYDGLGMAYDDIALYAYADFNEWHTFTKAGSVNELRKTLKETEDSGRNIATNGNNQYVLSYSDYLYKMRESTFGLSISDYAVPFVQMVVSGRMSYSTEGAGNLSYDLQTQKLKWVEFGSMPYFYLTNESAQELRDTDRDLLFSSTFSEWEPVVVETCKEFKDNFSSIVGRQMVEHTIISADVRRVKYDNGVIIYINYAEKEATADGITIPAKSYIVTGGEG